MPSQWLFLMLLPFSSRQSKKIEKNLWEWLICKRRIRWISKQLLSKRAFLSTGSSPTIWTGRRKQFKSCGKASTQKVKSTSTVKFQRMQLNVTSKVVPHVITITARFEKAWRSHLGKTLILRQTKRRLVFRCRASLQLDRLDRRLASKASEIACITIIRETLINSRSSTSIKGESHKEFPTSLSHRLQWINWTGNSRKLQTPRSECSRISQ